ncbi:MAG: class I SAM-dependent RNA methyltransferase [Bryobacteraceae bacterium]
MSELQIEKWVYGGDGLGRADGRVVLAPYVLPGERVRVSPVRAKPDLIHARLEEVLDPAPERVTPECPYFTRCGGCQYQHAPYEFQLAQKEAILREVLRRVGKIDAPPEIEVIAGPPWGYRNRVQLHIDRGAVGFLEHGSHRLCPVDHCPVSSPAIQRAIGIVVDFARQRWFPRFVRSLEIFTNETEFQVNVRESDGPRAARRFFEQCAERLPGADRPALDYTAAGATYRVSAHAFFQVNRFLIDALVDCALADGAGETAVDLYAGAGLFSVPMARRFAEAAFVETNPIACRDLAHNTGAGAVRAGAGQYLASLDRAPDFVLADPPRSGLGRGVAGELIRLRAPRVNIVSCDPATLARDLGPLLAAGYRIGKVTLIDLFPQTAHIECIAKLVL